MAPTLPRGLSPARLLIVFFVLLALLVFRSYYLPSPESSDFGFSTAEGWWKGKQVNPDDVGDVDFTNDFSELDDHGLISEIPDFTHAATSSPASPASLAATFQSLIPACRRIPGADKVVVMVKTGATEAFARVPEQIVTLAECVPNLMIFSDLEQDIGEFHIHDALDEIGKEYMEHHEDFQFYKNIHAVHAAHGDVSVLGSEKGWNLDKWKNIPMLHKAYTKYPNADWYVTIDADTYLGWTNLLLLLRQLDPDEPLYAGCVYWHGPTTFAQGGTGYILSRNAVQRFEKVRSPSKIAAWEKETSTICCGDVMLAVAMGHAGVNVSGVWPMFQVDPPSALSWNERIWCTPAITWHHSHSNDIEALWQFEREWVNKTWDDQRPGSRPYLYADAFDYFVQPLIAHNVTDWDNLSADKVFTKPTKNHVKENTDWDGKNDQEKQELWDSLSSRQRWATRSIEHCREACQADGGCIQFSWHPGTCKLNHSIKLGHAVDSKQETTSGWMLERIEHFKKTKEGCEVEWERDSF
ncbi:hypothetical protein A1O1_07572 [Capronia coronata CBS 617.96]|uniref:N-acetylgalactosaminide beta-1,3-galactosyltransferase n=1 Tax=Capronia coronata CBS 617.96 TaxID=1182541 RepID=W9XMS2_9EURO|nr:uncharacterized protein A1O1_07572 [Capronia coronata CBS 617.96]EXJ81508.1 hypothetical protein A1O1_07572 [Capronia coronata CBS 617.96]